MSKNLIDTSTFGLDDIPCVAASDLHFAVERLIAAGQAGLLLGEGSNSERQMFENDFWKQYSGNTRLGAAILVRLWAMADVLTVRRLQEMLHNEGFLFIRRVAQVAAGQRLNGYRGFSPQKIIWSLQALEQEVDTKPAKLPAHVVARKSVAMPLAA